MLTPVTPEFKINWEVLDRPIFWCLPWSVDNEVNQMGLTDQFGFFKKPGKDFFCVIMNYTY